MTSSMGSVTALATLALLVGCTGSGDPMELGHLSTLGRATNGVALHRTGETGHAGMFGTNCPFETTFGMVTGDYDLPERDEEVQDVGETDLGTETVVLVQPGIVYLLDKEDGEYDEDSVDVDDVIESRIAERSLVSLVRDPDCAVVWEALGVRMDVEHCVRDGFDVNAATSVAVVAHPDRVELADPDDLSGVPRQGEVGGDLVVADAATDAFFVATRGGGTVSALAPDGSLRWEVDAAGDVHAIADAGVTGAVVVMLAQPDGRGAIRYLDGWTGEELAWIDTPGPADGLTTSANGRRLAVVLSGETHFYRVDLGSDQSG